ncbi:ABC transporter substrate-binding protein [Candidatus Halocynthiibacter alkanivorans]|uniref:ABC transporter substrate-binding protein n=1 Tax=Candidatus Halocynthiibacter alkanivorans TaxID=2267619 RepID=UPI000DF47E29|nr:extracellular solute-binding protein [Candidatus Halocynthiibacter alkanivorans]
MRFAYFSAALTTFALSLVFSIGLGLSQTRAYVIEDHRNYTWPGDSSILRIISTADVNVFEPIIVEFQRSYPGITVDYTIVSSTELMTALYEEGASFDLAISSAMDLQTKLANDGFAQSYRSDATDALPKWASWRGQVFAFTQEPAVLVISEAAFEGMELPRTREDVITLLRDNPERFSGRIGTYDVRISGAGYLFATQDSRNTDSYWRLTEVMGRLNAQLYGGSDEMITDVASGRLALAYNVVGSYAASRLADSPGIRILQYDDFLNVMLRSVLIPVTAQNPRGAGLMIDFLATLDTRAGLERLTNLTPVKSDLYATNSASRPIRLGPGLLVFLDQLKKEIFLRNWANAIEQQ